MGLVMTGRDDRPGPDHTASIAIVGAGAIGCRLAAHLHDAGVGCDLFDGWTAHVQAIARDGLVFERRAEQRRIPLRAAGYGEAKGSYPFVFIAVRSDQTPEALPIAQALLAPGGVVVSCQNGLNEEEIAATFGTHRTLGCSMVFGARLAGPGHVQVLEGPDQLRVGGLEGAPPEAVEQLAQLLQAAGTVTLTSNLIGYRWMKLVLNATGNPLLLLTGLGGAELHRDATARVVMIGLTREILRTALACGARPEPVLGLPVATWLDEDAAQSLHDALIAHGDSLGTRRLSMVADFEARGRTEIDSITGKVVAKAGALGLAVPLNTRVLRMVHEMESGQRSPSPAAVAELAAPF
jgi:2-dehydropantoate 2-reductase